MDGLKRLKLEAGCLTEPITCQPIFMITWKLARDSTCDIEFVSISVSSRRKQHSHVAIFITAKTALKPHRLLPYHGLGRGYVLAVWNWSR